jgi:hypothetical protein
MTTGVDDGTLTRGFAQLHTGAVIDVLDELGLREQALPLDPATPRPRPRCGRAGLRDRRASAPQHRPRGSMLAIFEMLAAIPRQYVAGYQTHDNVRPTRRTLPHSAEGTRVRGGIIDGGCRDAGHILPERSPVCCR